MKISEKRALRHFVSDLFEYITMEQESGDLNLAYRLAKNLKRTKREIAKYGEQGAKDYRSQKDYEIAKEGEQDAAALRGLDLKKLINATTKELKSYAVDAADVFAALIKALNS